MRQAMRYRRGQAIALALLSALVVACAVFGAMYDRAVQQATVVARLDERDPTASGLRLFAPADDASVEGLAVSLPVPVAARFEPPVRSSVVTVNVQRPKLTGSITWREGACDHVSWRAGRCPGLAGEVAVSSADAARYGWRPGTRVRVEAGDPGERPARDVTVTGVYDVVPGPFWFGVQLTGQSGQRDEDSSARLFDSWLTSRLTFDDVWSGQLNEVDFALDRAAVGVDELVTLGGAIDQFQRSLSTSSSSGPGGVRSSLVTDLPQIAREVEHEREQAHVTIPLLLAQLAVLGLVALGIAVAAAVDQRRGEVALARLRGWGAGGARTLLLGELGPPVALGVPLGIAVGTAVAAAAVRVWLPGGVHVEPTGQVGWAVLLAAVAVGGALAPVLRMSRLPVAVLLREAPRSRSTWVPTAPEAVLLAVSALGFAAFASGSLTGPFAALVPALLAAAVGVVMGRILTLGGGRLGRRLLGRGHLTGGLTVLQLARRPAARLLLPVLTVATALLVFSADAHQVAARNREVRASAEVGAAAAVTTSSHDLRVVQDAVRAADPTGRELTAVAVSSPPGSSITTMAVTPDEFRKVASFGDHDADAVAWGRLHTSVPPLDLKGSTLGVTIQSGRLLTADMGPAAAPSRADAVLSAVLWPPAAGRRVVPLAVLPADGRPPHRVSAAVPCSSGCLLTGFVVEARGGAGPHVVVGGCVVREATADDRPLPLGPAANWWSKRDGDGQSAVLASDAPGGLALAFDTRYAVEPVLHHASVPQEVPALVPGDPPQDALAGHFAAIGLDSASRSLWAAGSVPLVPGGTPTTALVDASVLARDSGPASTSTETRVLFARTDAAADRALRSALAERGVSVVSSTTADARGAALARSAAAWSMQLSIVVGSVGLLLALLVVALSALTTWRATRADHTALHLSGVPRAHVASAATAEHLLVALLAVVLGTVCGLLGARAALPGVPLYATPPVFDTLDLSTSWAASLAAGAACALLLGTAAWAAAGWLSRPVDPDGTVVRR